MVIIDIVINTLHGRVTRHPAGVHCPSWDDAFVSSLFCHDIVHIVQYEERRIKNNEKKAIKRLTGGPVTYNTTNFTSV